MANFHRIYQKFNIATCTKYKVVIFANIHTARPFAVKAQNEN